MYHGTTSRRARIIEQNLSIERKERLRKEREKLIHALEDEKYVAEGVDGRDARVWNRAIERSIEVVNEALR